MRSIYLLIPILGSLISVQGEWIQREATKAYNGDVYVHLMPWFDDKTSGNGRWGIHWTMSNRNPDIIDETGKRQIAAHYYPEIGPYSSRDENVIEYQLNLMKYAGVTGVYIDWPGTMPIWDYVGNLENSNKIIEVTQRLGMKFAIVYEDHNIGMAYDAGLITDKIGAAQADMRYMNENYFPLPNYAQYDGNPVLLDFGPQTFKSEKEWTDIFAVLPLPRIPRFFILGGHFAGRNAYGEFCWVWEDYMEGLRKFYANNATLPLKIGGAYPGFNARAMGGWPDIPWKIPVGSETFTETLDLAISENVPLIQLNTWNDYGEGTIIEPTREFGNQFLTILQERLGVAYGERELNLVKELYFKRKEFSNDAAKKLRLEEAAVALNELNPDQAEVILRSI